MSDFLVTEMELRAPGYEATGKKVVGTTKAIAEAEEQGARVHKAYVAALQDSALPSGLDRIAQDAKAAASRAPSGPGGRPVASVGGVNWVLRDPASPVQAHPTVRPHLDWSAARKQTSDFFDGIRDGVQGAMRDLSPLKAVGTGLAAFAAVAAATGFSLMREAASFDSLRQSLVAIEGDSKKAGKALGDLKEIAKAPGIGFEQSVRGYAGLRNAGYDQAFAERIEREVANANSRGGGNAESFGRIVEQLRQAAGKEYLEQEDLRPISDAGVPVNSILKRLYGTGDTEDLKKQGITADKAIHDLVDELAKLPRVAGGAANSFDNAGDALQFLEVSAGEALNNALLPLLDDLSNAAQKLTENGEVSTAFDAVAANIRQIFDADQDGMEGVLRELLVAAEGISAGVRNLTENSKGFWQTLNDWHTAAFRPLGPGEARDKFDAKTKGQDDDFDDSAGGEMDRTRKALNARATVQKEHGEWKRAKDSGAYKGSYNEWDRLSGAEQSKYLNEADRLEKSNKPSQTKTPEQTKQDQVQERIARATERTAEYTKRQLDIGSASAGGGELTRLGVSPVELSGRSVGARERAIRHAAELLSQAMGGFVDSREVGNARHSSRS